MVCGDEAFDHPSAMVCVTHSTVQLNVHELIDSDTGLGPSDWRPPATVHLGTKSAQKRYDVCASHRVPAFGEGAVTVVKHGNVNYTRDTRASYDRLRDSKRPICERQRINVSSFPPTPLE